MKKLRQFIKNIKWLCTTDLRREWDNRDKIVVKGNDLMRQQRRATTFKMELRGERLKVK